MLSLYLDKVLRCFGVKAGSKTSPPKQCAYDLLKMSGVFNYTQKRTLVAAPSFSQFVEMVVNLTVAHDICELDHHLCKQVQGCLLADANSLHVLKLEKETAWFPCLAKKLNLSSIELQNGQWLKWKQRPCFYTPTGVCDTAQYSSEIGLIRSMGSFHATGANIKINAFYDRSTVTRVRLLYADDFRILGYPDELPQSFEYPPYTDGVNWPK